MKGEHLLLLSDIETYKLYSCNGYIIIILGGGDMENNKIIAKKELEVIGGKPSVFRYWDENNEKYVDILSSINRPSEGIITCATIGLSNHDIGMVSDNKELRIEILGACDVNEELFPNMLSTIAFEIMDRRSCGYGHIILDIFEQYMENCEMKHVYLMNPFLWNGFDTIDFSNRKVAWLLIVPISKAEKEYAIEFGGDSLETKFEEADIDIFDLHRESIL